MSLLTRRWWAWLAMLAAPALAYNPPVDTAGPLTVRILDPTIGSYGAGGVVALNRAGVAFTVTIALENNGEAPVRGTVRIGVIDRWTVQPAGPAPFEVSSYSRKRLDFTVRVGEGTYNAHYPIHAYAEFEQGGRRLLAHPVMVLATRLANPPRAHLPVEWRPVEVPAGGGLRLTRLPVNRVSATVSAAEPPLIAMAGETFETSEAVRYAGDSIVMALGPRPPSLVERVDAAFVEYPLALPKAESIRLAFSCAGAGVTFRVRVADAVVFEQRGDAAGNKFSVDLSRFAGQAIRLRLEANGARQASWIEPVVTAGTSRAATPLGERTLGRVRFRPGLRGALDGTVEFTHESRPLRFHGFHVRVLGDALEDAWSTNQLAGVTDESSAGRVRLRHRFRGWAGSFDVVCELSASGETLQVHWKLEHAPAPKPWLAAYLEEVAAGPWSEAARRVYAGTGNVIENPGPFQLSFDGHRLATSFVGFEFAGGPAIVQGVDTPPDRLEVRPENRIYNLSTPHEQTITFIPARDVWDGVKTWRDLCGLRRAAGVEKLAGRFVFDLWGGRYGQSAEDLRKAFRYGLTDAAVVWHNWQRWGYDYRLPDIYPPNPQNGTPAEFVELARACQANGVLFAPHDNYIDFYPDADGFSYDNIAFERTGQPRRAWYNSSRQAQSYRVRADRVRPFLERNLRLIRDAIAPTAYFIDVWSSMAPYDYWDARGQFFPRTVTREVWRESFAWIREFLGSAPQISEAGHDQLIGWLDGAQANHLRVENPPASGFVWPIQHADAERIPWFDAAYHDRFALHGAGYEDRYAAGLDLKEHGMYSRDYIATEVLDGHPAMVRAPFGRDVVRKYWLLHDLMRALALRRIAGFEFGGGNLHRQHVTWEGAGEVWVNRGAGDWLAAGHTLPQYGFYARVPSPRGVVEAAIESRAGTVIEWSRSPDSYYQGEYRVTREADGVRVTPLPASAPFAARITWSDLPWKMAVPRHAEALDDTLRVLRVDPVTQEDGRIVLRCGPEVFTHRLRD